MPEHAIVSRDEAAYLGDEHLTRSNIDWIDGIEQSAGLLLIPDSRCTRCCVVPPWFSTGPVV